MTASARVELQNSDAFQLTYLRDHEVLPRPFRAATGITVPAGSYSFQHARASWTPGQQRRLSGVLAVNLGQFYDGTRKTASANARLGITNQFGIEPNISINRLTRAGTSATVRVIGARTTYTVTPRMFVAALVQHSSTSQSLATNLRFRWEYQPGSELFVVYSDAHDTSALAGQESFQNRGLVIKVNKRSDANIRAWATQLRGQAPGYRPR